MGVKAGRPLAPTPLLTGLRVAALTVMAGCVVLPLVEVITTLAPSLNRALLLGVCALAALEAQYSFHLVHRHFITGPDGTRFRLVEFAFYFVAIRGAQLALKGLPPEAAGLWQGDLGALAALLLDLETVLALALAVVTAMAVTDVLGDLERIGEPPELSKHYVPPLDSLTGRFFMGGAWLVALSGLARIGLREVFDWARPPVTGLIVNVLVYFMLGFVLLGQVRLQILTARWQEQGVRLPRELGRRWTAYSLLFLGLAALLAFALPTGYTSGALGFIGNAFLLLVALAWALAAVLGSICLLPLSFVISLLNDGERLDPPPPDFTLPPAEALTPQALPPWLEVARTVVVWALVIGMVLYVVAQFLRDRPELTRAMRQLGLGRRLRQLWAAFRHRVSGLAQAAARSPLGAWLRGQLRGRAPPAPWPYFRLGGAPPRERVLFYYYSLLRRARERGFGRQPAQTPHEYERVLEARLEQAGAEARALTEAFEETRYSAHPVGPEAVRRARAAWERLRAALKRSARKDASA
jgi:hypothetical protein